MNKALKRIVDRTAHLATGSYDYEATVLFNFEGSTAQTFSMVQDAVHWARRQEAVSYEIHRLTYDAGGEIIAKELVHSGYCDL